MINFLFVLKIVGIIVLSIISLILFAIIIVLFVPIRYRLFSSYKKDNDGIVFNIKFHWLIHIITIEATYINNELNKAVRVFGIRIKKREKSKKIYNKEKKNDSEYENISYSEIEYTIDRNEKDELNIVKPNDTEFKDKNPNVKSIPDGDNSDDSSCNEKKNSNFFRDKIKSIINKSKDIIFRLKNFEKNIIKVSDKIKKKVTDVADNIKYYIDIFSDERNKSSITFLLSEINKILKHVLPIKTKGYIHVGTDDPASTGQILVLASILYPVYKKKIRIYPDFDNKVFEYEIILKGRIYIVVVLIIGIKLYFNKKLRHTIHALKKENLNGR